MRPVLSLPRSRPSRLAIEVVVLALIFALGGLAGPAMAAQIQQVLVVNPASNPVRVAGTVDVGNLPATQPVSGSVNVGNFPATQPVSGSVNVGNFPATQNVNVTGGSISAPQTVSTDIESTGFHSVAFAAGDQLNLGAAGFNVTAIALNDGLTEDHQWRITLLGVGTGGIRIANGSGHYFIAFPQPILASAINVQCLTANGCFWSIEVAGYPVD